MSEQKIKPGLKNVRNFLAGVENTTRRQDSLTVLDLIQEATGLEAVIWGENMVGFGEYHYKYESGREGDAMLTGFSPRKQQLVVYIMPGFSNYQSLMDKLGKYKTGKSCLYINKLADIDLKVLAKLIKRSVDDMIKKYH